MDDTLLPDGMTGAVNQTDGSDGQSGGAAGAESFTVGIARVDDLVRIGPADGVGSLGLAADADSEAGPSKPRDIALAGSRLDEHSAPAPFAAATGPSSGPAGVTGDPSGTGASPSFSTPAAGETAVLVSGSAIGTQTLPGTAVAQPLTTRIGSGSFVVNVTFDSSITGLSNASTVEAAFNDAVSFYTTTFANTSLTLNITAQFGTTGLGQSSTAFFADNSYSSVRSGFLGLSNQSADQTQAYGTLPSSDPLGGTNGYAVSTAQAKVLGLSTFTGTDGTITFSDTQTYTFDPSNRAVSGAYDFIGVAEHEISEVMGRSSMENTGTGNFAGQYEPMDLFRYSAKDTRQTSATGDPSYFSIDSGATNLKDWNNHSGTGSNSSSGDLGDWLDNGADAYNESTGTGVENDVTAVDVQLMNVLGYSACFCRGTRILTEAGEMPVEAIEIGDRVVTRSGAAWPVRWIGRRSYDGRFIAGNTGVLPIRIAAGAFAAGVPARDLVVSPGHAFYFDGVLVRSEHLVNGATIVQQEAIETVEYFHIELDEHQIIFAEGAETESYVDCDNRLGFANGAEYLAQHPDDKRPRGVFCAPLLDEGADELTAIRTRLLDRATALGYARSPDPDLHLLVDGARLEPELADDQVDGWVYRFRLPARIAGPVWLASRRTAPADEGMSADRRHLGVPVEGIVLSDGDLLIEARHGHAGFGDGFHDDEAGHRWTDGMARLPAALLRPFAGPLTLDVYLVPNALGYRTTPESTATAAA